MAKPPHNVQDLMLKLTRLTGSNLKAVEYRDILAAVVVGQMLPDGCVVKGGSSLRLRLGPENSRVTSDLDMARRIDEEQFIYALRERLLTGWQGFTGVLLVAPKKRLADLDPQYVMQPLDVKLHYCGKPLCTIRVEVSHNELGDAEQFDQCPLPNEVDALFSNLNFPKPTAIPLMPLSFQVAQKLHGLTEPNSRRVRDLIDLQLILQGESVDLEQVAAVSRRLFAYRKRQSWPPAVVAYAGWRDQYETLSFGLDGLLPFDEAISWGNKLIGRLDAVHSACVPSCDRLTLSEIRK